MRPDVKLGVIISMVVVLVAGGYFIFRGRDEAPVPVTNGSGSSSNQASEPSTAKAPDKNRGRADQGSKTTAAPTSATRRTTPAPTTRSDGRAVPGNRQARGSDATTSRPAPTTDVSAGRPVPSSLARRADATTPPPGGAAERPTTSPTVAPPEGGGAGATPATDGVRTADARSSGPPSPTERERQPASETAGTGAAPSVGPVAPAAADATGRATSASDAIPLSAATSPTPGPAAVPGVTPTTGAASEARRSDTPTGPAAVDTHRVQEGDTLSSLSRRYYGSEQHAKFLAESNPQLPDPNRLAVGAVVRIPPLPSPSNGTSLSPSSPSGSPGAATPAGDAPARTYRVQSGDSFYTIARDTLNDAARWKELFELNKELVKGDARRLQVGQVITLPPR